MNKSQKSSLTPLQIISTSPRFKFMVALHFAIFIWFAIAGTWSVAESQPNLSNLADAQAALTAYRASNNQAEKNHALKIIGATSAQKPETLLMIYQESRSLEETFSQSVSTPTLQEGFELGEALAQSLTKSTDPALNQTVVNLLEQEEKHIAGAAVPIKLDTPEKAMQEKIKEERFQALLNIVVQNANGAALPVLRRLGKRKDRMGFAAESAISQLKDPADLEAAVQTIKTEAHPMVDLSPYGPRLVDRLMVDIDNPGTPPDVRMRMIGFLNMARTKESIPKLTPLLRHKDPHVVEVAAETLEMAVGPNDESLVLSMIQDRRPVVRSNGILALRNLPWSPAYGALLLNILQKDGDGICQSDAADLIGHHRYTPAVSTLRNLMRSSGDGFVRESARGALEDMGQK